MSRKIVVYILTICVLISCANSASVYANTDVSEEYEYVQDVIPQYLAANNLLGEKELYLSARRIIYNLDTGEEEKAYYFVLNSEKIVGELIVQKIDGTYYSSYRNGCREIVNRLYQEEEKFVLGNRGADLILCTKDKAYILKSSGDSVDNELPAFEAEELRRAIPAMKEWLSEVTWSDSTDLANSVPKVITRTTIYTVYGQPPYVKN
ncbi:MAG: hypothetical protein K2N94_14200, partial [Lachnospiraceae bacterium]|nr:hypothetical protein [Lachnospiraceae bacterium]